MREIPAALLGLLQQAVDEHPWTCERRDLWMNAFGPVLDFSFTPIDFSVVEETDDEDGELPALVAGEQQDVGDVPSVGDVGDEFIPLTNVPDQPSKYIRWSQVIAQLLAGDVDSFTCRKRTSGVASFKSEIYRKYPGIVTSVHDNSDGWSTVKVTIGAYQGDAA